MQLEHVVKVNGTIHKVNGTNPNGTLNLDGDKTLIINERKTGRLMTRMSNGRFVTVAAKL